jgi:hypothetical protein
MKTILRAPAREFCGSRKKSNRKKKSAGAQESRLFNAGECDFERLRCGTVGERNSRKSIAVLPFENRSEEKANAYFADGIEDEILTRLSKIADLRVIPRTSTEHYKSAPENLPEIARQLRVAQILEGSVQKSGDDRAAFQRREPRDCRLANHRARARNAKEISVDRLFAAKIVTSGESQGHAANYLHS